jgi:hypothetical protein
LHPAPHPARRTAHSARFRTAPCTSHSALRTGFGLPADARREGGPDFLVQLYSRAWLTSNASACSPAGATRPG